MTRLRKPRTYPWLRLSTQGSGELYVDGRPKLQPPPQMHNFENPGALLTEVFFNTAKIVHLQIIKWRNRLWRASWVHHAHAARLEMTLLGSGNTELQSLTRSPVGMLLELLMYRTYGTTTGCRSLVIVALSVSNQSFTRLFAETTASSYSTFTTLCPITKPKS